MSPVMVLKCYPQEGGLLYTRLPSGVYLVDDKPVKIESFGGEEIVLDRDSKVFQVVVSNRIDGYRNEDTGAEMSQREYLEQKHLLESDGTDEEGDWKSITARHQYELFVALWKPFYTSEPQTYEVLLEMVGEPPINHDYIKPIRKLTGDMTNTLYRYDRAAHAVSVVRELLIAGGFEELDYEPSSYGIPKGVENAFYIKNNGLEFSRIIVKTAGVVEATYLTIAIRDLKQYEKAGVNSGTYGELLPKFEAQDKDLRRIVKSYVNRKVSLNDVIPVGELVSSLNSILSSLQTVEPMKKSRDTLSSSRTQVRNLLTKVQAAAADKENK